MAGETVKDLFDACGICYALVERGYLDAHLDWHDRLSERGW